MSEEPVGEKIDRLNSVINQLMTDLENDQKHKKQISIISSFQQSFCDYSDLHNEELDDQGEALHIPELFLDKFQEALTEIDRLGMKIEDLVSEKKLTEDKQHVFYLTKDQISLLLKQFTEISEGSEAETLFKLTSLKFECLDLVVYSSDIKKKLEDLEVENLKLKTELLKLSKSGLKKTQSLKEKDLIAKHLELERQTLVVSIKEQELDQLKEEYGIMISKAEILLHDYKNKTQKALSSSKKPNMNTCASPDITRAKTSINSTNPLCSSFFSSGFLAYKKEIEQKLEEVEKFLKDKYKKRSFACRKLSLPEIFEQFRAKDKSFLSALAQQKLSEQREKMIVGYLKENRDDFKLMIEELSKYQQLLFENWAKDNSGLAGVEKIRKITSSYVKHFSSLARFREMAEEKFLRCEKIEENIKLEVKKLQEHRKKILVERQVLLKQQEHIEKYLKIIASLNRVSI